MEVKRLGNLYGFDGGNFAGNVYEKNALAPTILNMQGGGRQPMIIENVIIGGMQEHQSVKKDGVCTCLTSSMGQGGGYTPMIVAMRGRNPDNPSDRTTGATTEQRLEPNSQGICNTLTSVQKDNLVMEKYRIRKLTPKECWRLMAFTDEDFHKAEAVNSNTQLYKQAGNSIVVTVLEAIFRQMNIQGVPTWNESR